MFAVFSLSLSHVVIHASPEPVLPDVKKLPAICADFSAVKPGAHGPRSVGPRLGEHTESVLRDGWSTRHADQELKRAGAAPVPGTVQPAFCDVVVVEVSDFVTIVPSLVGALLLEVCLCACRCGASGAHSRITARCHSHSRAGLPLVFRQSVFALPFIVLSLFAD